MSQRARYAAISEQVGSVQRFESRYNDDNIDIFRHLWALGFEASVFREDWATILGFFRCNSGRMKGGMFSHIVESILTLNMPQGYRVHVLQV